MAGSARLQSLTPFDLHKQLINHYVLIRKGSTALLKRDTSKDKRDIDIVRENHKFLWDECDEPDTWEKSLAKKYYDKLFKEYCICDLSRFKENKVAMRWQTEEEMVSGKGQFICGDKRCNDTEGLRSWEVNFSYFEEGAKKNALVKLRLCSECSYKLNYKNKKKEVKNKRKRSNSLTKSDERNKKKFLHPNPSYENTEKCNKPTEEEDLSVDEPNIWKDSGVIPEERSRDEHFEDYLEQLLL